MMADAELEMATIIGSLGVEIFDSVLERTGKRAKIR
jgi:hypothetical protein